MKIKLRYPLLLVVLFVIIRACSSNVEPAADAPTEHAPSVPSDMHRETLPNPLHPKPQRTE